MTDDERARREEVHRMLADEFERDLAMTMSGVSGRMFVFGLIAATVGAVGVWTLMLYAAQRLHG